ncbi:hypothetical protein DevBK_11645 [Devosia sp. BK]|uniref:hypothetical protein n=1 Tax=Devosia sp. BK TaxID=2871706 RepID=UPI002939DDA3|nr:hypothetical protein [Devosia sp. BK]MDV3251987.1 hypothetical protein [Devosia sp. BK]
MFAVHPDQVEKLKSDSLVLLLGRLLHAEAQAADLHLGGISVPLQITVADGGVDGLINWTGGPANTEYLPGRYNVFQCKAGRLAKAGWKKECWVKSTQRGKGPRALTPGLTDIIAAGGSYIGFTIDPLNEQKRKSCIAGIREGITEAGGDPTKLAAIKIYGANEIAQWAQRHPAVAIWLAEQTHGHVFAGFRTLDWWGTRDDFVQNPYVADSSERFSKGAKKKVGDDGASNLISSSKVWASILDHITPSRRVVRVAGASGLGKSRFVYQSLQTSASHLDKIVNASAIYVDYRTATTTLLSTASVLADAGRHALLVVDECPRGIAVELGKIATGTTSKLRVITIDTDIMPLEEGEVLHFTVYPDSKGELAEEIIRQRSPEIEGPALMRLKEICGGFPRFAVLAAGNMDRGPSIFETAGDIVTRILEGASIIGADETRALQCLSLFENVAIEGDGAPAQLDVVAQSLARMTGDEMYEHLAKARQQELVGTKRGRFNAQPPPIALELARRRLEVIRPSLFQRFVDSADHELLLSMLSRWRDLDTVPLVRDMALRFLHSGRGLETADEIMSAYGSSILDALVHVIPDKIADRLADVLIPLSRDQLTMDAPTRRNLVEALSKLAFRSHSFRTAARLLMKLGSIETEEWGDSASATFKQLFRLYLSGTEVPPPMRFAILDEGLASGDADVRALCIDVLAEVFSSSFSRAGEAGQIGSGPALEDWHPQSWDEVDDFYRNGLKRLVSLRSQLPSAKARCEAIMASATRMMMGSSIYREWADAVSKTAEEKGTWPEAIEAVGDWLFFDRSGANPDHDQFVRDLYDRLFPTDLIERAIVFTQFWQSDIRDPEIRYADDHTSDFEYSARMAVQVADQIAQDSPLALKAVDVMASLDLKTVHAFAARLGEVCVNRSELFDASLLKAEQDQKAMPMLRGLLSGINVADEDLADRCFNEANERLQEKVPSIDLYTALPMQTARLQKVITDIERGVIRPAHAVVLSYGRGLEGMEADEIGRLMSALAGQGSDGIWAALEIALMYRHGKPMAPEHARNVAGLLAHPQLLGKTKGKGRDRHILETMVDAVRAVIGIDTELADALAGHIVGLAMTENYDVFSDLTGAMRRIVVLLRQDMPQVIWAHISRFYEKATPIDLNRMERLIAPSSDRYGGMGRSEAGLLFGLPNDMLLAWADLAEDRPGFLLAFFPVLEKGENQAGWHPALDEVAQRYGHLATFRAALSRRLRPSSWSGSIVPLLELYFAPLKTWFNNQNPQLATWAQDEYHSLERRIVMEREHEKRFDL